METGNTETGNIGCEDAADFYESLCVREISPLVEKKLKRRNYKIDIFRINKSNSYRF